MGKTMSTNQIDLMKLFQQIKWAESGDTVDFSETNYSTGWSFLGDDTPTVEDFNALQQWNDKKDQWLYSQIAKVCQDQKIAVTENDLNTLLKAIKKLAAQPNATTEQVGVTQLDSSTDSNAEDKAATPKAVKVVKDLINALTRNLANYIPNSKKSDAVDSASSDTVATSNAVKTAYDKGVEALSVVRSKQSPSTTLAGYGISDFIVRRLNTENLNDVSTPGIYGQPLTDEATTARNYPTNQAGTLMVSLSAYGVQQEYTTYADNSKYVRGRKDNNWLDWTRIDGSDWDGVRGKPTTLSGYGIVDGVNKNGDALNGNLKLKASQQAYNEQLREESPLYIPQINWNGDAYYPFIKALFTGATGNGKRATFGLGVRTYSQQNYGAGVITYCADDNTLSNWYFHKNGDFVSAGDVFAHGGLSLNNLITESLYPRHYSGAKVLKLRMNYSNGWKGWKIMSIYAPDIQTPTNGEVIINLPEAVTSNAVVNVTDNGSARFSYSVVMHGVNKIKIFAPASKRCGFQIHVIDGGVLL
ncbi:tail fiber protein [Pasteurellaceae bacterium 22721_9_1]